MVCVVPFQSTPSQRGRLLFLISYLPAKFYFNPRPRKEGDKCNRLPSKCWIISIHALAKRATYQLPARLRRSGISIHALAKRATHKDTRCRFLLLISIHALAKRATLTASARSTLSVYFNPRPRKEGDGGGAIPPPLIIISIHALAKRATTRAL